MDTSLTSHTLDKCYDTLLQMALQQSTAYDQLNALRDGFNQWGLPFDLYLEDNWNEPVAGETHFEYRLRSLTSKDDLGPLGIDVYTNHCDAKGVWHLGDYQYSFWCQSPPQNDLALTENAHPDYATLPVQRVLQFLKTHRVDNTISH